VSTLKNCQRRRQIAFETLEPRTLLAGDISLVRYFDTWDAGIIPSTDVAGIAYHEPSGHLYLADSEISELPEYFNGNNLFEVSLTGDEIYREIASNNDEPTGITYNTFDGYFYVTNDDKKTITRYDDRLNTPLAVVDTRNAVQNAADPEGVTSDPVTGLLFVADGHDGGRQVLVYDSNLAFLYHFSVASHVEDAEGIALHPTRRHLFLVSALNGKVFEYTIDGHFVDEYDISHFSPQPKAPQGLTFAPTSDPNDDPGAVSLYIADGGWDNQPDGRVYEAHIGGEEPLQNMAPLVFAGSDQMVGLLDPSVPPVASLDATVIDDGRPIPPGALSTQWTMVSGPAMAAFDDASAVDTTVTLPAAGTYILRLTAHDGALATSDELTVTVYEGILESLEVRVAASSDDAEERVSSRFVTTTSTDLDIIVDEKGRQQIVGLRFNGLAIPPGSTIRSASIQFLADQINTEYTSLAIQGEATDDAATFTTAYGDLSSRIRTAASVSWFPPVWTRVGEAGSAQRTSDISSVIQEIVDRPGWSGGNSLAVLITGDGVRTAEAYDGRSEFAPLLYLEVSHPLPGRNMAPLVDAGGDRMILVPDLSTPAVVMLDATVTDDGKPDPPGAVTTQWTMVSGPAMVTFDDEYAVDTTVSLPAAGTYVLRLTATDGELADDDELTITVEQSLVESIAVRVAASSDDAEERVSSRFVTTTSTDLDVVVDEKGRQQIVGLRFNDVAIPHGATILRASIQFQADEINTESTSLAIQGEATDHAATFVAIDGDVSSRSRTIASVPWFPAPWATIGEAGFAQQTPDLSAVIQEVVDRPGWTGGSSLAILITGNGVRTAEAYDGKPDAAPLLYVEFSTSAPGENIVPVVDAGGDQVLVVPDLSTPAVALLDATVADDGQPIPPGLVTKQWTMVSGPAMVTFDDPYAVDTAVSLPAAGTYVLRLTADDGELAAGDEVTITVEEGLLQTVEIRVGTGSDDAEERVSSGFVTTTSTDLDVIVDEKGRDQIVGLRFNGVAIPQGATIQSAYVQFQADEVNVEAASLTIQGEASDHAATFTAIDRDISSRPRTTASVPWSPEPWTKVGEEGPAQQTSDISDVIREIINRPGWASGNSLAILITGSGVRTAEAYDGKAAGAPLLRVRFSSSQPGQNTAPLVDAGGDQVIVVSDLSAPAVALLDATVADDGQPTPPGIVTQRWTMVSGPAMAAFDDEFAVDTTVSLPAAGTYVLRLTADDGELAAGDESTITVQEGVLETFNVQISASSDDAEERISSGKMYLTSTDLDMVLDKGLDVIVGLRFNSVGIPQGATIQSAYLQFQADEVNVDSASLVVQGEAADHAATFTETNGDLSSRPRTTASTPWSPDPWTGVGEAGPAQQTPDIFAVIQEIVARPEWTSGNSLAILITGSGLRVAEAYDGRPDAAALLQVVFSTGGGGSAPLTMAPFIVVLTAEEETVPEPISFVALDEFWWVLGEQEDHPLHITVSSDDAVVLRFDGIVLDLQADEGEEEVSGGLHGMAAPLVDSFFNELGT